MILALLLTLSFALNISPPNYAYLVESLDHAKWPYELSKKPMSKWTPNEIDTMQKYCAFYNYWEEEIQHLGSGEDSEDILAQEAAEEKRLIALAPKFEYQGKMITTGQELIKAFGGAQIVKNMITAKIPFCDGFPKSMDTLMTVKERKRYRPAQLFWQKKYGLKDIENYSFEEFKLPDLLPDRYLIGVFYVTCEGSNLGTSISYKYKGFHEEFEIPLNKKGSLQFLMVFPNEGRVEDSGPIYPSDAPKVLKKMFEGTGVKIKDWRTYKRNLSISTCAK